MNFIDWDNSFSVNVIEIDEQHKKLISVINELHSAMKIGKSKIVMDDILTELIKYAKYHFNTEEKIMEKFNYPGILEHKKEHKAFIEKVDIFFNDYKSGNQFLSIAILDFLSDWLKNHIKKTDMNYSEFFNDNGIY